MAHPHRLAARTRPARAARRGSPLAKLLAAGLFCTLSYAGLTAGAFGPASDDLGILGLPQPKIVEASLDTAAVDPVVTASFNTLFATAAFNGPNRAEKVDRVRPAVDVLALSRSFDEARTRIAALRGLPDPTDLGQTRLAEASGAAPLEDGPRMSIAAINPNAAAALDAIAGIAPSAQLVASVEPMPAIASDQLAYARANAPVTGGFSTGAVMQVSDKELWCLATAIYFEARGEAYRGQVAVAQVVLNRTKDRRYPNTICGVVYQNQSRLNSCQFSFACDGIPEVINDQKSWAQAQDIAKRFTDGELYLTEVGDATHYHATYVSPAWAPRMTRVTQIGLHIFYKFKNGWMFG